MATPAHSARIYSVGASTVMTAEACTLSGGNAIATITSTVKRIIDPDVTFQVYDNAVLQAATTYTVDLLLGIVTKNTGSFTGPVTVTGAYLPRLELDRCTDFSVSLSRDAIPADVFSADSHRRRIMGLISASASVGVIAVPHRDYDTGGGELILEDLAESGAMTVFEVTWPSGHILRMFCRVSSFERTAEVAGRIEGTLNLESISVSATSPGVSLSA